MGKKMSNSNGSGSHNRRAKKDKGCWCCRKIITLLFSHIGLCGLVIGYTIFGAYLFRSLEGPFERHRVSQVAGLRNLTVHQLWNITDKFNVLYKENWTEMVSKELLVFQQQLVRAVKDGFEGHEDTHRAQWTLSGSFLYSLTVITTIGEWVEIPATKSACNSMST